MDNSELKKIWAEKFASVPQTLKNMQQVQAAATAFNANIDAVVKISGKKIAELAQTSGLDLRALQNVTQTKLLSGSDVVKGIFKCFTQGIAEEWLTEDKIVYDWMVKHLGYDRLQMGGQGGIVANVLAVTGVNKVYAHANSLPKLQAEQFLKLDNLLSFDVDGTEKPAHQIDRQTDIPLIHWIIEFDKGDSLTIDGQTFVCPKSNRFIATYEGALPIIENWKSHGDIVHLEIASTQDIVVRKSIIGTIAPKVDSIGINEREAMDILEVCGCEALAQACDCQTHSVNMFEALLQVKKVIKAPRVQLHMFGLYMTLQDKGFKIAPEANLRGMMLAATVAAGKAGTGNINQAENLLWAQGQQVSDVGLDELRRLSDYLKKPELLTTGLAEVEGFDLIALPTILVEKPLTLVGMGDTISSLSLIGAR